MVRILLAEEANDPRCVYSATLSGEGHCVAEAGCMVHRFPRSGWRLDHVKRQLQAPDGHGMNLTGQEMILMELLFKHANQVVTRRMIAAAFDTGWLDFDERRLDQLVSRLRRRWRKDSATELPLRTEHRQGYSFIVSGASN